MVSDATLPEIAFYYPGPVWSDGEWVKNLILFFDGFALLVPDYLKNKPYNLDPAIVAGLESENLLHIIEPESAVDKKATKELAKALSDVLSSGALDELSKEDTPFHEISYSRLGGYGDETLAREIFNDLKKRGLARDTEDGVSIPMHPQVRSLVLVLLAQILKPYGTAHGMDLSPATDRPQLVDALTQLLSLPTQASSGHVVSLDMQVVGVDMGPVPIDEVLSFRTSHLDEHRAYTRCVRKFVRELSPLSEVDREAAIGDRIQEVEDLASGLRALNREAWRKPTSFALALGGAAWTVRTGDPIGAILGFGGGVLGLTGDKPTEAGAYSYVFSARNRYF
jgi:hypothetical protein